MARIGKRFFGDLSGFASAMENSRTVNQEIKEYASAARVVKEATQKHNIEQTAAAVDKITRASENLKQLSNIQRSATSFSPPDWKKAMRTTTKANKLASQSAELARRVDALPRLGQIDIPSFTAADLDALSPSVDETLIDTISYEPVEPHTPSRREPVELSPEDLRDLLEETGGLVTCLGCGSQYLIENASFAVPEGGDRPLCRDCRDADLGFR